MRTMSKTNNINLLNFFSVRAESVVTTGYGRYFSAFLYTMREFIEVKIVVKLTNRQIF